MAKVVDDTFRFHSICFSIFSTRIHTRELTMSDEVVDLIPSRSHSRSDFNHFRPKEESSDFYHVEAKVRCLCNSTMLNDNMIKVSYPFIYVHVFCFHLKST